MVVTLGSKGSLREPKNEAQAGGDWNHKISEDIVITAYWDWVLGEVY